MHEWCLEGWQGALTVWDERDTLEASQNIPCPPAPEPGRVLSQRVPYGGKATSLEMSCLEMLSPGLLHSVGQHTPLLGRGGMGLGFFPGLLWPPHPPCAAGRRRVPCQRGAPSAVSPQRSRPSAPHASAPLTALIGTSLRNLSLRNLSLQLFAAAGEEEEALQGINSNYQDEPPCPRAGRQAQPSCSRCAVPAVRAAAGLRGGCVPLGQGPEGPPLPAAAEGEVGTQRCPLHAPPAWPGGFS